MKRIILTVLLVALTFGAAYAVELTSATDVQLMEQFLLPNASAQVKQNALIGVREMLNLAPAANAAECVAALKSEMRKRIRDGFLEVQKRQKRSAAISAADSMATADLWAETAN